MMDTEVIQIKEMSARDRIDLFEAALLTAPQLPQLLFHRFTPGLYTRELYMLKGTLWTSEEHLTRHQYIVLEGCVSVFTETDGEVVISGPYIGITEPGTKRVLFIHENTRWITFHPTSISPIDDSEEAVAEAVKKIKDIIIGKNENKFLKSNTKELAHV